MPKCSECDDTGVTDGTPERYQVARCTACYCKECTFAPCQCLPVRGGVPQVPMVDGGSDAGMGDGSGGASRYDAGLRDGRGL